MKKFTKLINLAILLLVLFVINLVANQLYYYLDLTEDKRYTLADNTVKLLDDTKDNVFVNVYLDGTFPASVKRFRDRVQDVLNQFQAESPYINYQFIDPLDGTPEEVKLQEKTLVDKRLYPTTISYYDGEKNNMKPIFPYAVFKYGTREVIVNLLDIEGVTNYDDETLHVSEGLLEYKFANAVQKLQLTKRPIIAFTTGRGELPTSQMGTLFNELKKYYTPTRIDMDSIYRMNTIVDVLVVAGPKEALSDRSAFLIDQYVMQGGKVIWLIESMDVRLDSIAFSKGYIPPLIETNLDQLFFKYGFKILDNTILDLECTQIPQVVGSAGGKKQMSMFKYYYHPLLTSRSKHPIVKNIDRVNMFFPSTIDTVITSTPIKKTFLLESSKYSRYQMAPLNLNFRMLGKKPQISKFNRGNQGVALLLEGNFESAFKNRLSQEQERILHALGSKFYEESKPTAMIAISDVEFTKNLINNKNNQLSPLGFNKWDQKIYKGNKDLILNSIEYLLDENGILASRAKEFKMRLLDEQEVQNNKRYWQSLNIAFPLITLALGGLVFYFIRRSRYAKQ